jgi:hypothetical protein
LFSDKISNRYAGGPLFDEIAKKRELNIRWDAFVLSVKRHARGAQRVGEEKFGGKARLVDFA